MDKCELDHLLKVCDADGANTMKENKFFERWNVNTRLQSILSKRFLYVFAADCGIVTVGISRAKGDEISVSIN
jgi:hypothetical protein